MTDVLFVLLTVAFFAVAALYVRGCARILGPGELTVIEEPAPQPADTDRAVA
jgi:hypothetical protein